MGMAARGRSGTAGSPYCWTLSVFVRPLLRIVQYPVSASRLTVTGSEAIPSAGGTFRYRRVRRVLAAVAGDGDAQGTAPAGTVSIGCLAFGHVGLLFPYSSTS